MFLTFRLFWLLNFMKLYMFWRKLKSWDLLMSGWNVTLPWFVLRLLLGQMFLGCFVIDEILVLIIVEKSGLGLLIFFVKGMCVSISWLIQDLFIENLFIGIIGFHVVCSQNSLLIGIVYLCIVSLTYGFWSNPPIFLYFLSFSFFNNTFFM